jgi:hypothetical protein
MPDQDSKLPQQTSPAPASRPVGWLIDPDRGQLLPLAGIWILALDWLLFSSNLVTAGLATPIVMAIGFIVGGGGTLILQKWIAKDPLWKAFVKALVAGIVVGAPWPLAGTLVGGWVLLAAGMKRSQRN